MARHCVDCGKEVKFQYAKRCRTCYGKTYAAEKCKWFKHGQSRIPHYCVDCGKQLSGYRAKRCRPCVWKRMKGMTSRMKGVRMPDTVKVKLSKAHKGMHNSPATEFKKGMVGSLSNNWKGGITPLNKWLRCSPYYRAWAKEILKEADFTCLCGKRGVRLEVHHIRPFSGLLADFLHEYSQFSPIDDAETLVRLSESYAPFWDKTNTQVLCLECHNKTRGRRKACV